MCVVNGSFNSLLGEFNGGKNDSGFTEFPLLQRGFAQFIISILSYEKDLKKVMKKY